MKLTIITFTIIIAICLQVVALLDAFPSGLDFIMVFEYMPTGLWEVLRDTDISLTPVQIKTYMKMLLEGIAYVHGKHIIHRVLKYSFSKITPSLRFIEISSNIKIFEFVLLGLKTCESINQRQWYLENRRFWLK